MSVLHSVRQPLLQLRSEGRKAGQELATPKFLQRHFQIALRKFSCVDTSNQKSQEPDGGKVGQLHWSSQA
ncbi:hypothetical protein JTE90_016840 [Oedothorax gibbosus]|uniref:Uncharacterized protein n=1 Tax=Oedothorax gibbosus TaxID=931172 RepID=A0AAV6VXK2_9ARAC|nr:hypothetical protein JTE90_016840 [Oedothorax gibbosus]